MADANDPLVERAIMLAREAHGGQKDKGGADYVQHPLRVMEAVRAEGRDAMIAAVLHDVVEDCAKFPPNRLRAEGFPEDAVVAVETVTKRPEEKKSDTGYAAFIERIATTGSRLAIVVKLADLADNSDLSRLGNAPTEEDLARARKYERARRRLEAVLREAGGVAVAEEKETHVEILTPEEMAQLHPMEQRMHASIMAELRKEHADDWENWLKHNRETIRDQIAQVTGAVLK